MSDQYSEMIDDFFDKDDFKTKMHIVLIRSHTLKNYLYDTKKSNDFPSGLLLNKLEKELSTSLNDLVNHFNQYPKKYKKLFAESLENLAQDSADIFLKHTEDNIGFIPENFNFSEQIKNYLDVIKDNDIDKLAKIMDKENLHNEATFESKIKKIDAIKTDSFKLYLHRIAENIVNAQNSTQAIEALKSEIETKKRKNTNKTLQKLQQRTIDSNNNLIETYQSAVRQQKRLVSADLVEIFKFCDLDSDFYTPLFQENISTIIKSKKQENSFSESRSKKPNNLIDQIKNFVPFTRKKQKEQPKESEPKPSQPINPTFKEFIENLSGIEAYIPPSQAEILKSIMNTKSPNKPNTP